MERSPSVASNRAAARLNRVRKHSGGRQRAPQKSDTTSKTSSSLSAGGSSYLKQPGSHTLADETSDAIDRLTDFQIEEFREAFKVFDVDGSGNIDKDELRKLMLSVGQNPDSDELDEMVRIADADGSGEVDFFEFVALMAHKMADPVNDSSISAAFSLFDRDNDGNLSVEELRGLMLNVGEPTVMSDINQLLSEVDTDQDGVLDVSEFTRMILHDQHEAQKLNSMEAKSPPRRSRIKNLWRWRKAPVISSAEQM